jgi:hypothetical protein
MNAADFVHRELILRIEKHGLGAELRGFITAIRDGLHPPRIYKPSGINPSFLPYEDLELHHHHLHRDGDPLLITQKIDGDIYGIALATHETYFREDKMQWLKDNAGAIDWTYCPLLYKEVMRYDPFAPVKASSPDENLSEPDKEENDPPDDIPF